MPVITPSALSLSIHLPSSCLIRPMQPHPAPPTTQVVMGVAWALLTTPCSCSVMGVIAVVLVLSAWCHLCCGCWCASGCRSYCNPAHRNIISVLKIKREKNNYERDQEVISLGPIAGFLIGTPVGIIPGADWLLLSLPSPPLSYFGGGSCSCYCSASQAPHVIMVPVPFCTCSLCANNCQ